MGKPRIIQKNQAREVVVSFQPSRVGSFHAVLGITFIYTGQGGGREFTVTRELRGRATLPGGFAINDDVEGTEEGGTGITVSDESGLEFLVERSDVLFSTQTRELVITSTSTSPMVTFKAADVYSVDDTVAR
jgi:hypothetical protein